MATILRGSAHRPAIRSAPPLVVFLVPLVSLALLSGCASSLSDSENTENTKDTVSLVEATPTPAPRLIAVSELDQLTAAPPRHRLAYGQESALQFGHLRLPDEDPARAGGRWPVVIFVHGGCWLSQFDIAHVGALEVALAGAGYAVWSLEYRRVGDDGGGWPGTFLDIGAGADHLRELALRFPIDLERLIAAGHSAGGQLALWLASREHLPRHSDLWTPQPLPVAGVLALAPAPHLEDLHRQGVCGGVIGGLMGGSPEDRSERYAEASPMLLPPLDVPVTVLIGAEDHRWAPGGRAYADAFSQSSDLVLEMVPGAGHFELVAPHSEAFERVLSALASLRRQIEGGARQTVD